MFSHCPRCGHAPLPAEQALPAACPACGVVLAKVGQPPRLRVRGPDEADAAGGGPGPQDTRLSSELWWLRAALWLVFALWGLRLMAMDPRTGEMAGSFLHAPLLVFHEAGHVLFMPFGEWMHVFGGSLNQVVMPVIMAAVLLRQNHDPCGASFATWFAGVSLMDLAAYIYDAFDPQLMLLGGHTGQDGPHDWVMLLSPLGLLDHARALGLFVHRLGAGVLLASLAWGAWTLRGRRA